MVEGRRILGRPFSQISQPTRLVVVLPCVIDGTSHTVRERSCSHFGWR